MYRRIRRTTGGVGMFPLRFRASWRPCMCSWGAFATDRGWPPDPSHLPAGLWLWALTRGFVQHRSADSSTTGLIVRPGFRKVRDFRSRSGAERTSLARRKACNTVAMDAGPDAFQRATAVTEPPLGASPARNAGLGPISPELALVDPELARRSRELLPEPHERPKVPQPRAAAPAGAPPAVAPELEIRTAKAMASDGCACSGDLRGWCSLRDLLGNNGTRSSVTPLEVAAVATTTQPPQAEPKHGALRPPKVSRARPRARTASAPFQRRRHARVAWASNVLGVSAFVGRVWRRARVAPAERFGACRDAARPRGPTCERRRPQRQGYEVPRCLASPLHPLPLHDRQLRPARAPLHGRSYLGRDTLRLKVWIGTGGFEPPASCSQSEGRAAWLSGHYLVKRRTSRWGTLGNGGIGRSLDHRWTTRQSGVRRHPFGPGCRQLRQRAAWHRRGGLRRQRFS